MSIRIALAGNPNSGKTTLFNALTGSNQYVGNWPGVTVEKKEGRLKDRDGVTVTDLPGIYSLSPYTPEEIVARNYLVSECPEAILNIVDGSNLERNLYLTTQLCELGIPVVVAINMMDVVKKNGDRIDTRVLSHHLGCPVVEVSALKGEGIFAAADAAIEAAKGGRPAPTYTFSGTVEHTLAHVEEAAVHHLPEEKQRWYAVKLFERDERVRNHLGLSEEILRHIEKDIASAERILDDDAEAIIAGERYNYIERLVALCCKKKRRTGPSLSDRVDRIVTNRVLALPIFVLAMFLVYYLSIGSVGNFTVSFMNEGLFGSFAEAVEAGELPSFMSSWVSIPELLTKVIGSAEAPVIAPWLHSLIMEGIVGGVGAVLGFVPQMMILFLLLSLLEDCGYMSRVAFIMDRIFRKFGLSGKSFIPLLVASGCGVPGIMASRTIEQERDRRMTIMTTGFIPCGAKMPIVGLIAGALFGGSALIAASAYFVGIGAVILSGLILKKTKPFLGDPAPFVMELPAYHAPVAGNVLRTTWDRGWSFIKKAGTVILLSGVIVWILNNLTFEGGFGYIGDRDAGSILTLLGESIAWLFKPLGFGHWEAAVATVLGLMAKEEVVSVFGNLGAAQGQSAEAYATCLMGSGLAGYSFLLFNLLCAPCFAAMGAIKREMNSGKWTAFAIGYMCVFAYAVSLIVYQLGAWFIGEGNIVGTVAAAIVLIVLLYLLFRPNPSAKKALS